MSSTYRETLNKYLAELEVVGDVIYDVGGAQESLPKRVKRFDVGEYVIFDLETPHRGSTPAVVLDLNDPMAQTKDWHGRADAVYCFEVFEYVFDPATAMYNLWLLMKPGGTLTASFPFLYPMHEPYQADYLRYTEPGICRLARNAGLTVIGVTYRRPTSNLWRSFVSAERMRPSRQADHDVMGYIVEFKK